MARAPRATISKTSGQGISRGIYKAGRRLAGKDNSNVPKVSTSFSTGDASSGGRDYSKSSSSTTKTPGINVSYGNTIEPTDLKDVQGMFGAAPAKGPKLSPTMGKKLK